MTGSRSRILWVITLLLGMVCARGEVIEHHVAQVPGQITTTTTGWQDVPGAVIPGSSFTVGDRYLVLVWAEHNNNNNARRPWSWPIIHTVSTRFMQNQGTLQNLARSRLKLLEAVCLPSMQHQSIFHQNKLVELYENTKWKDEVTSMIHRATTTNSSRSS